MGWKIKITEEARQDFKKLDNSIHEQILAGIVKVSSAPLPRPNGYGKPLGNKQGNNLTGFFKIKYKGIGIRVVYTLVIEQLVMNVVVISERDDEYCYKMASKLYEKYGDSIFGDIFENL
ncbi:MAG: type II toxin-antitoxin system RelE/ParE family toxin [Lachnospiraceae bacterium]|nr:type II toxin-antitoxin system RelE/ParE family toxin [Lachnospiraceae bacterium]